MTDIAIICYIALITGIGCGVRLFYSRIKLIKLCFITITHFILFRYSFIMHFIQFTTLQTIQN